ncbi:unnamed protein product [Dibothriocephalus latus]|uniref:Immunoglobulin subtype domain-containing protein n=1 Tax=Dibothriocephalus latus TaxID=60516 RepID=A0A3P7L3X8_DIBLA|nr:unnamed protein product [Dibothriocephalus latus]
MFADMLSLLLLLLVGHPLLTGGSSIDPNWTPFDHRMVTFINSRGFYPGDRVFVRCAFNLKSPVGMTGEISFVHKSYIPAHLRTRSQQGFSFELPSELLLALKEHGEMLNVTHVNTSFPSSGFRVTAHFRMGLEREGFYLCKLTPHTVLWSLYAMRATAYLTLIPLPLGE